MTDVQKGKDSLMKKLLSAAPNISSMPSISVSYTPTPSEYSSVPSPTSDCSEDTSTKLTTFLRQLAVQTGRELNVVLMDHAYSKPSHWRSENTFAKPTKALFVHQVQPQGFKQEDKDVDVEDVEEVPIPPYDMKSVSISMSECDKYIESVNPGEMEGDWEEQVDKTGWSGAQIRVFAKAARALHLARLARLAAAGGWREPLQRRVAVDKAARRLRLLLAAHGWEPRTAHWLHATLLRTLSPLYLGMYMDVLQTLRAKCPVLVERMLASAPAVARPGLSGLESLQLVVKQPWDPVASSLSEHRPQKLPGGPIIVMVPSAPVIGNIQSPRLKQWEAYFGALGVVVSVVVKAGPDMHKASLTNCLDQMVCATRVKVAQLRADHPQRHVVLVGWDGGAAAAAQVALVEQVSAVVCLGFPVLTVEGRRGEPNDCLLDLRCPAFFAIGQNAASVRQEDMEDIRERMRVETGLVVVGAADDLLRVSHSRKQREGLTQAMVDRCILDEVADFLGSILMVPRPPPLRTAAPQSQSVVNTASAAGDFPGGGTGVGGRDGKRKAGEAPVQQAQPSKRPRPGTPLHGASGLAPGSLPGQQSGTGTAPSTPNSSPLSAAAAARLKNRGTPSQKGPPSTASGASAPSTPDSKWSAPPSASSSPQPSSEQGPVSTSGITVNIGSLGSLTPLGPLRLQQQQGTTSAALSDAVLGAGDGMGSERRRTGTGASAGGTSLTIQGNLISATGSTGAAVAGVGRAGAARKALGAARGKEAAAGTLTPLSSLLQPSATAAAAAAAGEQLLQQTQQKALADDAASCDPSASPAHSTALPLALPVARAGRVLDLSKLSVGGRGGGGVVVARGGGASPLLVAPSPFALLPLTHKGRSSAAQDARAAPLSSSLAPPLAPRSFTVIPKISVPSLKLGGGQGAGAQGQQLQQLPLGPFLREGVGASGSGVAGTQTVTVASATKLAFPAPSPLGDRHGVELIPDADERRSDELTPDKILELPIIFAKDGDDTLFVDSKGETLGAPTVLPFDPSPTVTLGDTISFPLDDADAEKLSEPKHVSGQRAVPNVFIIRSKGHKERLQPPAGKRLLQKHRPSPSAATSTSSAPSPVSVSTPVPSPSAIKYTKIILTNRNSSLKVGEVDPGKKDALHGGIILDDDDDDGEFDIV